MEKFVVGDVVALRDLPGVYPPIPYMVVEGVRAGTAGRDAGNHPGEPVVEVRTVWMGYQAGGGPRPERARFDARTLRHVLPPGAGVGPASGSCGRT